MALEMKNWINIFMKNCCIILEICIPQSERVHVIREAQTSLILGHFGVGKTVAQLQIFCY